MGDGGRRRGAPRGRDRSTTGRARREWSRDGQHLYFTMQDRGQVRLMRVPQGGGAPERLVADRGSVGQWALASDGTLDLRLHHAGAPG